MKDISIGTWLSLPNESIAEIFSKAGYEWVVTATISVAFIRITP